MAGSVSKTILIGNLGADPQSRKGQNDKLIVGFRMATSERWKDRESGEKRERTDWHSIVIYDERLAEIAVKYLKKGSKVYVQGKNQTRKWTDDKGIERYTTEVVLRSFGSELNLLDKSEGSQRPDNLPDEDQGEPYNRRRSGNDVGRDDDREGRMQERAISDAANRRGYVSGQSYELDDDIPF